MRIQGLPGPGMDGFYHVEGALRMLQECGLLEVFKVDVLEEMAG